MELPEPRVSRQTGCPGCLFVQQPGKSLALSAAARGNSSSLDGKINIDDYTTVIDANIGNQNGIFPTAPSGLSDSGGTVAVPEPMGSAACALGAFGALLKRRRRKIGS